MEENIEVMAEVGNKLENKLEEVFINSSVNTAFIVYVDENKHIKFSGYGSDSDALLVQFLKYMVEKEEEENMENGR